MLAQFVCDDKSSQSRPIIFVGAKCLHSEDQCVDDIAGIMADNDVRVMTIHLCNELSDHLDLVFAFYVASLVNFVVMELL